MQSEIEKIKLLFIIIAFLFFIALILYRFYEKTKHNKKLRNEIEKRKEIEAELRLAQEELRKELNNKITEF